MLAFLSSEVLLRIMGYLNDARDLSRLRQVNQRFNSVAGDALLWRDLFVYEYLRPVSAAREPQEKKQRLSHSGSAAADASRARASASTRLIRGLPRMKQAISEIGTDDQDRKVDWYALFKISRNWQTGNFSSRQLQTLEETKRKGKHTFAGPSSRPAESNKMEQKPAIPRTLIDSTQTHIFTASHSSFEAGCVPTILVFSSECRKGVSSGGFGEYSQESLAMYQSEQQRTKGDSYGARISALAVDKATSTSAVVGLFIGYSNGASSLLHFNAITNQFQSEQAIEQAPSDCIVSAAFYSPLLVTCTFDFKIRILRIEEASTRLLEERRTYSCHWPASLKLDSISGVTGGESFRLSIAYSSPVYPIGWTVGLQEIIIGTNTTISSRSASARRAHVVTRIDSPSKGNKRRLLPNSFPTTTEEKDRRIEVGKLTSLSYEDPFIVVGTTDNDVVCFRVTGSDRSTPSTMSPSPPAPALPAPTPPPSPPLLSPLLLSHVCTFQGHTGAVHSVSLNEGRCVTGGSDGSVRVWKLGDEEAAVAKAAGLLTTMDASLRRGLGKVVTIASSSLATGKRKRVERSIGASGTANASAAVPLSLADILRETQNASRTGAGTGASSSAVVRWVTSAFDQIISVSAIKSTGGTCRSEAASAALEREEEQVQIWNFSR